MMLLSRAKNGARGNAATKMVTNPYCRTKREKKKKKEKKIKQTLTIRHVHNNISTCTYMYVR